MQPGLASPRVVFPLFFLKKRAYFHKIGITKMKVEHSSGMPRKNFLGMLLGGAAALASLGKAATQSSGATKIMIIRHAEKPVGQINGIDESGNQDSLIARLAKGRRADSIVCGVLRSAAYAYPYFCAESADKHHQQAAVSNYHSPSGKARNHDQLDSRGNHSRPVCLDRLCPHDL